MNISELRDRPHLSVSSIKAYTECGMYYKFSRIDKLKRDFVSDNLVFGSTIHKALADFQYLRLMGMILDSKELEERFSTYWTDAVEAAENIRYSKGKDFHTLLFEGKKLLKAYHNEAPIDAYTVLAIEEPFSMTIEGLDVPIIGIMDLVEEDPDGTVIITDFKTSSKAYSNDQINRDPQLTVYQMAARANGYRDRNVLLKFDVLVKTQSASLKQYYTSRTTDQEERMERKILQVWDAIKKGVFIANDTSWKCPGCEYKSHCDAWFERGGAECFD